MNDIPFSRYAIYAVPDPDSALFTAASRWLGWNCVTNAETRHPVPDELKNPAGVDISSVTDTPRKYGFHGTIKPPMRLAAGCDIAAFASKARQIAAELPNIVIPQMKLARIGSFLALVPAAPCASLEAAAARFVTELDPCRAPLNEAELARRRQNNLSARQDALLAAWGYPYVLDEFRFHMTLSGSLDTATLAACEDMLTDWILPVLPQPFTLERMALVGEGPDGRFRLIDWLTFRGHP